MNFKTIANLKTDIDTLKSTINETNIEYQELKAENLAIKDIAEHRSIDITKLKNELQDSIDQNNQLNDERRHVESQVSIARDEKRKLLSQVDHSSAQLDELNYRNNELEKVIRELDYDKQRLDKNNSQTQAQNDHLRADLNAREDNLRHSDAQVGDSQKAIMALEADIKELERANEKARNESIQAQRENQQQVTRNLELNAKINSAENTLRSRDIQVDDLRRETESLNHAHANLLDSNLQLNQDLENLRRNIDQMTSQNHQVRI